MSHGFDSRHMALKIVRNTYHAAQIDELILPRKINYSNDHFKSVLAYYAPVVIPIWTFAVILELAITTY
uniref:Neur_chan_memb domain-containing protein n=1 Tax=Heterorhabditis bacteriophora TaxID=37862 RepID=A0A1I7WZM3_HETBA